MAVLGFEQALGNIANEVAAYKQRGRKGIDLMGQAYCNDVKAGAPRKKGDYVKSIHVEPGEINGQPVSFVGTNAPQARRLEKGFFDMTDKLARHYYQYPRPHFRPPLDTQMDKYLAIMRGELTAGQTDYGFEKLTELITHTRVAGDIGLLDTSTRASSVSSRSAILGSIRPDLLSGASQSFGYESTNWGF